MMKIQFRMSESDKCPKALSAKLLKIEPTPAPDWLEKSAEEGKWHEERIKHQLMESGCHVGETQQEFKLEYPSFELVGHIDGVVITPASDGKQKLLEIKSMSQFEFDRWMREGFKGFPNYASQISCYMEATGLKECFYIVKNRSSGYEDRRVLTEKPKYMTEIIGHLTDVTNYVTGNQMVPRDFDPQSLECRRCEYKHLCIPEPIELTPVEKEQLDNATEDWRAGKALVERGSYLVDKAKGVFEQHTRATNILKWRHNNLAIQMIHTKRESYDKKELLKFFKPKELEPALKVTEYDQLRINDLEEQKETDNDQQNSK